MKIDFITIILLIAGCYMAGSAGGYRAARNTMKKLMESQHKVLNDILGDLHDEILQRRNENE